MMNKLILTRFQRASNKSTIFSSALLGALMFVMASCQKNEVSNKESIPFDPGKPVVASSFAPDQGRIRDYVMISGSNFGNDVSAIKVFFNSTEAKVISSIGSRILVVVPRCLPGDTEISVQIADQPRQTLPDKFFYKVSAQVTTLAGASGTFNISGGTLDKAVFRATYLAVDAEYNLYATVQDQGLLLLNEEQNSIRMIMTFDEGFDHRAVPRIHPQTGELLCGAERDRDRFIIINPANGWDTKMKFIKNWNYNGYPAPFSGGSQNGYDPNWAHYGFMFCEWDEMYYTRYSCGHIVRIDPVTWEATVIGRTPPGACYGIGFNTATDRDQNGNRINLHTASDKRKELWISYNNDLNTPAYWQGKIFSVDITDTQKWSDLHPGEVHEANGATNAFAGPWTTMNTDYNQLMSSFTLQIGEMGAGNGFRDGPFEIARINNPRAMSFDDDGNLFLGDHGNHCIRQIDTKARLVTTLVGIPQSSGYVDGARESAKFANPHGIVTNREGNIIYVADYNNYKIRKITIE